MKDLRVLLSSRDRPLSDLAVRCFVDIFRVSSFGSKTDVSVLRLLVPDVQNSLLVLFEAFSYPLCFLYIFSLSLTTLLCVPRKKYSLAHPASPMLREKSTCA